MSLPTPHAPAPSATAAHSTHLSLTSRKRNLDDSSANPPKRIRASPHPTPHGSYKTYYTRRLHASPPHTDPRLPLLKAAFRPLHAPAILDIGCNTGALTVHVGVAAGASRVVGVDIDAALVERASKGMESGVKAALKVMEKARKKRMRRCATPGPSAPPPHVPHFSFRHEDFSAPVPSLTAQQSAAYDAIMCLSVTKWVHLHGGDAALKRLFERMYACLRPGGILVLEPQPRHSYKRARQKGMGSRTFAELHMKPENFVDHLMAEGFESYTVLRQVKEKGTTFNRPVFAFYKAAQLVEKMGGDGKTAYESANTAQKETNVDDTSKKGVDVKECAELRYGHENEGQRNVLLNEPKLGPE